MAYLVAAIPAVMGIFSSMEQKTQSKLAGIRAQGQHEIEAKELEYQAGQVKAVAQQAGFEERRKSKLLASRVLALSAAGGGGTNDPSVVNIIGDIEGEGAYRQAVQLYQGEQNALRLKEGARVSRQEGSNAMLTSGQQGKAYDYQAAGYAASGASSMYAKYSASSKPTLSTGTGLNN